MNDQDQGRGEVRRRGLTVMRARHGVAGLGVAFLVASAGSALGQDAPKPVALTKTAEFQLASSENPHAVRDIEWFAASPENEYLFLRREKPYGTFTIVRMNRKFEIVKETPCALPWPVAFREVNWCWLATERLLALAEREGLHRTTPFVVFDTSTANIVDRGELALSSVNRALPSWDGGCVILGGITSEDRFTPAVLRFDEKMRQSLRMDDPFPEDRGLNVLPIFASAGTDAAAILDKEFDKPTLTVYSLGRKTPSRATWTLPPRGELDIVSSFGDGIAVLVAEKGMQEFQVREHSGETRFRRQASVALDTRAELRPDVAYCRKDGSFVFTDGHAIFEITDRGHAHKRVGADGDAPLLREIEAVSVGLDGRIVCQDVPSGALFAFDRDGKLLCTEPTNSVDFPSAPDWTLSSNMAVVDGGGVMLQSRASGKHILRFSPELILVERLSVKTTDWSIDRRSLTRCEIGAGLELILRRTNNKIRRVQLQTSVQSSIYNVKLIGDDSVVVLASERDTAGSSIFCQTTKGDVWFKAHLTFAHHLDAGSRWVCASNDRGEGLLVHLETKRTFPFDTRDGKASSQRRSYFIDESQASGDELVEIDRVTRIVRRFAMPKVSASPESAPAVK